MARGRVFERKDRGKWCVDIYIDGKRIKRLFDSKSSAMVALSKLRKQKGAIESDLIVLPKKAEPISFNVITERYLNFYEKLHTKKTFQRELDVIKNHLAPFFRDLPVAEIDLELIDRYKVARLEVVSKATVRKELAVLSSVLSMAGRHGHLSRNVVREAEKIRIPDRDPVFLSPDQAQAFLANCSVEFRPLAMVYLYCGLRRDEAFDLTWDDIDLESELLTVRASTTKGKRARTIPIHPDLKREILQQRIRHPQSAYVFPGAYGRRRATCQNAFRQARSRARLSTRLRLHDLRHTWASNLLAAGVDPMSVKEWGGWSSIKMLDIYGHADRRNEGEKIRRLKFFGPQVVPKKSKGAIDSA